MKLVGLFVFVFAAALMLAEKFQSSQTKTLTFVAAHGPYLVMNKPLEDFKKEVEEKTSGRIQVKIIVPDGVDDNNLKLAEQTLKKVESGEYQMSQMYTSRLARYNSDLYALETPFLFRNHEHSFEVVDGLIGKAMLAKLETNSQLKGLGFTYCGGYRVLATKDKKIQTVHDLQGLTIASGSRFSTEILKELGVNTVQNVQMKEVRTGLENNSLDGTVTVYPRYFYTDEYKSAKVVNELFFNIQYTALIINKEFFNSLSPEHQQIVEIAATRASKAERLNAMQIVEDVRAYAKTSKDITIVKFAETEKLSSMLDQIDWQKKFGFSQNLINDIKNSTPTQNPILVKK